MYTQPYPEGGQGQAHTSSSAAASSLLVADCGAVFTKVSLFGLVEGQYRLLARGEAPTTILSPNEDLTVGIIQAITIVEFITGRHLVADKRVLTPEQENGDGVDVFIATISAGGPLRLVALGGVSTTLESLISQAVSGLYAEIQSLPAPSFTAAAAGQSPSPVAAGGRPSSPGANAPWTPERINMEWERQLARMRELNPQGSLIVGMADGPAGPNTLQEACQLLVRAARDRNDRQGNNSAAGTASQDSQMAVLYAGAPQYVEAVKRMVQGVAEVTRVESLTGPAQVGPMSVSIGALHDRAVIHKLPGYNQLQSWSATAPIATATSLSSLVRFLAQHYTMNVTVLDVGGSTTSVMQAGEQGDFIPMVNVGLGVGPGASMILQRVGWQRVARWLPFAIKEEEIRQFVANMLLHPHEVPTASRDLQLSQAFAREAIMLTTEAAVKSSGGKWSEADLILATGGVLAHAPKYGQVVLMLLDALQPRGVTSLVVDKTMLISQLGAVAAVAPITAVQVNENDAVTHRLGTCVIPYGDMQPGQLAVRVGVEYSNGRQQTVDVMAGSIEVIPLRLNEQALLTLFPAPTVDVGLGAGERARAAEEIDGGLVGLIIDARGRPLVLPTDQDERQARLLQWSQAVGA